MDKPSTGSEMGKRAAEAIAEGFAIEGPYAADIVQIIDREYAPLIEAAKAMEWAMQHDTKLSPEEWRRVKEAIHGAQ